MVRNVTIEDIVRAAGVGKGTVDRVLHNRGYVSEGTRQKVLQCIEELGYKPNSVARMLANKGKYRIAVCTHGMEQEKEFWEQFRKGICRARDEFEQMGVEIEEFVIIASSTEDQIQAIEKAREEKCDGLVIAPGDSERIKGAIREASADNMSVVIFNTNLDDLEVPFVGTDGIACGRTAGKMISFMAPRGSRCMLVSPYRGLAKAINERKKGFLETIQAQRQDIVDMTVFDMADDPASLKEAVEAFVGQCESSGRSAAIYATNAMVSAVAEIIDRMKPKTRVWLVGHDLTDSARKYLDREIIDALILQNPQQQAYDAITMICKNLLTGAPMADHYLEIGIVVKENCRFAVE